MSRILIIDDDKTLLDLLTVHLRGAGYSVVAAADPAVAIRTVLANPPDVILLDILLPYLDGLELLKALQGDPLSSAIPVVMLTALDDSESFIKARALGATDYITKPVQRDDLLAAIEKALARKRRQGVDPDRVPKPQPQ